MRIEYSYTPLIQPVVAKIKIHVQEYTQNDNPRKVESNLGTNIDVYA